MIPDQRTKMLHVEWRKKQNKGEHHSPIANLMNFGAGKQHARGNSLHSPSRKWVDDDWEKGQWVEGSLGGSKGKMQALLLTIQIL